MTEQRNIIVLGAAPAGLQATHYIMKHILPALKAKHTNAKYHVYTINPSADFYFRVASPRVGTSTTLMPVEKIIAPLSEAFKKYSADEFTFIQGYATGLDYTARQVVYQRSEHLPEEKLSYHALLVATGSKTHHPAFSMPTTTAATVDALKTMNTKVAAAKDIVIVGGGPTGVETAGEIAEFRNGKPGWFSAAPRKVNITLITATNQLLPTLSHSVAKIAEKKLKDLGVDVVYNTRAANVSEMEDGRTKVVLTDGKELEADLYIPAYGVLPNSSWLPPNLLNETNYLITNPQTLRVDLAGPRVYALGDISSASRNTIMDLLDMLPVSLINIKRDLLSYNTSSPTAPAPGKDRIFTPQTKLSMIAPIGSGGGVGAVMGWKAPSWFVWLLKGRDYMVGMSLAPTLRGDSVKKEYKWTKEEAVV
ncbi:FAD/NAD(P)-binding domain-containing protein [Lentithecium fluviatile CBS 122367]|uniref:FAD/NAD(P)-binding domain-containing protein n=1 Tax=Lentithecium fluviatile CBS 122367 TaxID=1168545 RepID=A0A6G1ICA5_9PLEO|nr:FAD/NAD(P)-binding domain-containing protein [Lentithecium fluviatile CBS 122367]